MNIWNHIIGQRRTKLHYEQRANSLDPLEYSNNQKDQY